MNVSFAIQNHFSLAKCPPLLVVGSSASVLCLVQLLYFYNVDTGQSL